MKEFSQQVEEIKKEKDVLAKKLALMEAENAQIRQEAIESKKEIEKINEVLGFYKLKFTFLNQNVEKVQEKIECNRN